MYESGGVQVRGGRCHVRGAEVRRHPALGACTYGPMAATMPPVATRGSRAARAIGPGATCRCRVDATACKMSTRSDASNPHPKRPHSNSPPSGSGGNVTASVCVIAACINRRRSAGPPDAAVRAQSKTHRLSRRRAYRRSKSSAASLTRPVLILLCCARLCSHESIQRVL